MRTAGLALGMLLAVSLARAQAPLVEPGGVVNDGSYAAQGVAPGSIIAIFGTSLLASSFAEGDTLPLSTSLASINSVTFNGVAAGLFYAIPTQIDAQLPWESMPGGTVNIVVRTASGTSAAQTVTVLASVPGIFTVNEKGTGQAIATDNADNAFAAPTGSVPGSNAHPFSISTQGQNGHALIIWCTGLGAVSNQPASGAASPGAPNFAETPTNPIVMIGGVKAQVLFSGLAPGFVGENQVDVLLGAGTPTGNAVPVT